jgi:hypothetical protein
MKFQCILVLSLIASSALASAEEFAVIEDTPEAACEVLKQAIAGSHRLPKPDKYWYCDNAEATKYVYTMALRSSEPRTDLPEGAVYSNLMGWYAVARRSPLALEWDINEDRLLPLESPTPTSDLQVPQSPSKQ